METIYRTNFIFYLFFLVAGSLSATITSEKKLPAYIYEINGVEYVDSSKRNDTINIVLT